MFFREGEGGGGRWKRDDIVGRGGGSYWGRWANVKMLIGENRGTEEVCQ